MFEERPEWVRGTERQAPGRATVLPRVLSLGCQALYAAEAMSSWGPFCHSHKGTMHRAAALVC